MGPTSLSPRRRRGPRLLAAVAVCWALAPGVAVATMSSDGSTATTGDDGSEATHPTTSPTAAIEVTVTPLVGEGRDDGDLVTVDEDAGFVALLFSPTAPPEQRAVHEVRVRNTGDAVLSDVEVTDDRMGTIVEVGSGGGLAPGEELVTRAAMTFTFEEVATDAGGLVTSTTTASATAEDGTAIVDTADTRVELVAVLSSPTVDVVLEVVPDTGDVEAGDPPIVRWTAAEQEADEVRVVRYRVSVTNTSTVDLERVTVVVDVLDAPLVAADEDVTLAPDEMVAREFDRELRPSEIVDPAASSDATTDATAGTEDVAVDLTTTATVTAVDSTQDLTATARDDALVRAALDATQLPAAGLDAPAAWPLAVVALGAGAMLLCWSRPAGTASPRRAGH